MCLRLRDDAILPSVTLDGTHLGMGSLGLSVRRGLSGAVGLWEAWAFFSGTSVISLYHTAFLSHTECWEEKPKCYRISFMCPSGEKTFNLQNFCPNGAELRVSC